MKIKDLLKKNKFKILVAFFVLVLISTFFFFSKHNTNDIEISFLNVDEKKVDSILSQMSIEEETNQILFVKNNSLNENISGGIIYDSVKTNDLYIKNSDSIHLIPFKFYSSDLILPKFIDFETPRPDILNLSLLADTNFIKKYINFCFLVDSSIKRDFIYIPFDENILKYKLDNKNVLDFYNNLTKKFVEKYSNYNKLLGVPFIDYSLLDTAQYNKWEKYYNYLFTKGVNFLVTKDIKAADFARKTGFLGIIITQFTNIENIESFLASSADMIYSDDSFTQISSTLIKLCKKNKNKRLLDKKVKKILMAKIWLNENNHQKINKNEVEKIVENKSLDVFRRNVFKKSIVTVENKDNFLPVKNLFSSFYLYEITKTKNDDVFGDILRKYISVFSKKIEISDKNIIEKIKIPSSGNLIISFDTVPDLTLIKYLYSLDSTKNLIIIFSGKIENLNKFNKFKHLIFSPQNNDLSKFYIAQLIFGGIKSAGLIPDFIAKQIKINKGILLSKIRFGYDIPEMVGLRTNVLKNIDSIAQSGIVNGSYPGCQVFIAKNGVIVWEKAYGFHTYQKRLKVRTTNLYDIASVTKIAATTIAAMKMFELGRLSLDKTIGTYFRDKKINYDRIKPDTILRIDTFDIKEVKNWKTKIKGKDTVWLNDTMIVSYDTVIYSLTPKNNIFKVTPRQLLMHKSGIQPAMPILRELLIVNKKYINFQDLPDNYNRDTIRAQIEKLRKRVYSPKYIPDSAQILVAKNMYLRSDFFDSLWKDTKQLPVSSKKDYVYSDVNMILLQMTIDSINRYSISKFVENNFYKRLYLRRITYKPLRKFGKNEIIPTENDKYWRKQLVWGTVHDPSAAILGQVAGNAGIFSNAFSLGVLGQMLLNGGTYGGNTFLSAKTIKMFTKTQKDSYRGLGFDKWSKRQIIAKDASPNTYGHTGFTGTCMWIDPDNQIVFVFLSNRVNPSMKNWRLNKYRIRQKIHQTVYDAMK